MKSRNLLILLVFFNNCLHAEYESMQKYKKNLQTRPSEQDSMQSKTKTDLYVIEFKDLNAMDTYSLEKKYNLRLVQPKLCNRKLKISPMLALKAHSLKIDTTNKVAYNFY